MSIRSAEVANKQHFEGIKKVAELEAECQRLRGLVRKKLPGPAATCNRPACPQDIRETTEGPISLIQDSKPGTDTEHVTDQELLAAISQIHDFVLSMGKEAMTAQETSPDGHWLSQKIEELSASVNKVLYSKMSLADFVLDLSHILVKASELNINVLGYKGKEGETSSSDCVEKVTLLENKVDYTSRHIFPRCCGHISHSTSNEVPREGNLSPGFELKTISCKCSSEELEQLKSEKDSMTMDLARCIENLQNAKSQLQDTEQLLAELKSQLASSQKSNSLAETQLKCMAESYKSLEMRAHELETEVNLMRAKTETLDTELHEEKRSHQDALARCKDLHEQMQRNERCLMCSLSSVADVDIKTKQLLEKTIDDSKGYKTGGHTVLSCLSEPKTYQWNQEVPKAVRDNGYSGEEAFKPKWGL